MKAHKTATDAARAAIARFGIQRCWTDRIREMIDHVMCTHGHPNGDRIDSPVALVSGDPYWPWGDSQVVVRRTADDATFVLTIENRVFVCKRIGGAR